MNHLAHLYIANVTATSHAGALLGDIVRGRLTGGLPASLELGIWLHRRVDTYTDSHPVVRAAWARLPRPYRRYAGILTDIYFDHLLARQWPRFHATPLASFARRTTRQARLEWPTQDVSMPAARLDTLPERLAGYRASESIAATLAALDRRLSRNSPLPDALPVLQAQDQELAADFERFFPDLLAFAQQETARAQPNRAGSTRPPRRGRDHGPGSANETGASQ